MKKNKFKKKKEMKKVGKKHSDISVNNGDGQYRSRTE